MILAGTGHRPPKLGGYSPAAFSRVLSLCSESLSQLAPSLVISGMALGFDQALAQAALDLSIPFDAFVPCPSQPCLWPASSRALYDHLLSRARSVRIISPTYSPSCMQARNVAMVNACTDLLALWDGSPGGTANCLAYARTRPIVIHNRWSFFTPA